MCRRWSGWSNSLTLHSSLHQQLVNINTWLNEVDQCCFWQVDDRIGWHFLNRIWWKNILEKVWESVRKDFCEHNLMKRKYFLCVLEAASQGLWRKFGEFRVSCSWFKAFMKLKEKLFMKIIRGKGCLWCKESCLWWEFKQKMARTRQELLMKKIRGKQG